MTSRDPKTEIITFEEFAKAIDPGLKDALLRAQVAKCTTCGGHGLTGAAGPTPCQTCGFDPRRGTIDTSERLPYTIQRAGIYTASRTQHAGRWIALRAEGVPVMASWIDEAGPGQTTSYEKLWERCVAEAFSAGALILYSEPGEVMKGALVELGAALAGNVPVFIVGEPPGSVRHHRLVTLCETLEEAVRAAMEACAR